LSYFLPLLSIEKNQGSNYPETPKQYNLKNHSGKFIENKTEKVFFLREKYVQLQIKGIENYEYNNKVVCCFHFPRTA